VGRHKPLPEYLKYKFLGPADTLPVIIASDLHVAQEEKFLDVLREHKEAIGWTIEDIKGISPSVGMHKIHLEEDTKPSKEPQRRLNPTMQEVVRGEIIKLLDTGIIYPISDSKWVNPIHVVPDVNFNCTRKCTNRLQLMDCKCEVDPTGNCVFANKI
jgi:hypothetical protein